MESERNGTQADTLSKKGIESNTRTFLTSKGIPIGKRKAFVRAQLSDFEQKWEFKAIEDILITGKTGSGKTHWAVAYAKKIFDAYSDISFRWQPASQLIIYLHRAFHPKSYREESELAVLSKCYEPQLLVLDDFGATQLTEYTLFCFYSIFEQRLNNNLSTIITTNLSLPEIHDLDPRIASRLASYRQIVLMGEDRRITKDETDKEFEAIKELGDAAIKATESKEPKKEATRLFPATIPEFPDDDIPF